MSKRSDTWMPLYIGDYLRKTMHLTIDQHGAYLMLIMACWCDGGTLPDDDQRLAAICRVPISRWRELRPVMSRFFVLDEAGWHNNRVSEELAKADEITNLRRKAGSNGAANRWQTNGKQMANAIAEPSQNDTPSQSHSEELSLQDSSSSESGDYVADRAREDTRETPSRRAGVSLGRPPPMIGEGENTTIEPALVEKMAKLHGNEPVARALNLVESKGAHLREPAAYFVAICRGHAEIPPPHQAIPPPEPHPPRPTPEKIEALRIQYGISREEHEQTLRECFPNEAA